MVNSMSENQHNSNTRLKEEALKVLVEVTYALPEEQSLLAIMVSENSTVKDVIEQSGILEQYPEIDLQVNKVGIFSKLIKLDHTIREKDRIEIYRPLIADPKEVRKKRAAQGKALKKGGA